VRHGFTLIEILIVVVILGILAAIVIPQFTDASREAASSNLRSQLQTIRSQIELFNVQNPGAPFDPATPLATFWDALLQGDYLQTAPVNPLTPNPGNPNDPTAVAAAAAVGGAWVWSDDGSGDAWTWNLYAVDIDGTIFSDPDTGTAY
jgi:prepilin-type N-terminal cleavage/methylation domain-containing protein